MKLEDAWYKIMGMENSESFGPNQIHSILADLGVFNANPRIKIALKDALAYGIWKIVFSKKESSNKLESLKMRLLNDGFSDIIVSEILLSVPNGSSFSDNQISKMTETNNATSSPSTLNHESEINLKQTHILFLGKELGCDITEMLTFLANRGFKRTNFSHNPKCISLTGTFAGVSDCQVLVWQTISHKVWSIVVNMKATFQFIKDLFDSKYKLINRLDNIGKYSHKLIYKTIGGEISISHSWKDNRICYTDTLSAILNDKEIAIKNSQLNNLYKSNLNKAAKDI